MVGLAVLLTCAGALVMLHAIFFDPAVPLNLLDEGYISAMGIRLVHGQWLPYVDGVSHRGPMLYWVTALVTAIDEPFSFRPVRLLALACSLATLILLHLIGYLAKRSLAGAAAMVLTTYLLAIEMELPDGMAYNGELLLNVFALASFACLLRGSRLERRRARLLWTALAGLLLGLAVLTKQVALVLSIPFALLAAWPISAAAGWTLGSALVLLAGAALPILATLGRYAAAGATDTFIYYFITYNLDVYMSPLRHVNKTQLWFNWAFGYPQYSVPCALIIVVGAIRALTLRVPGATASHVDGEAALWTTVTLAAMSTVLAANLTLRGFGHYLVQAIPWLALLVGLLASDGVSRLGARIASSRNQALFTGAGVALFAWAFTIRYQDLRSKEAEFKTPAPFCEYVESNTSPGDAIYMWGFAPHAYVWCKRFPASRFVYSTFLSGWVPFFNDATRQDDEQRVVPGARALLLQDLEATRPALIIDAGYTMGGRNVDRIPELEDLLRREYCAREKWQLLTVYRRRDRNCSYDPGRTHRKQTP